MVFYDFKRMWRYGFPTVQWLHMHVQQMTQPRGLIILTNLARQHIGDVVALPAAQPYVAALDQICSKGEGSRGKCEFRRHAVLFRYVYGKFPWLFDETIDIDEAFASFLPRCRPCQGISCTSRKRTEGFCDRGRKETRMTGHLVIKALDFETNCAAVLRTRVSSPSPEQSLLVT